MPKLLIVDDEPENIELLTRRLSRRGFAVAGATSAEEALAKAAAEAPDVILMDIKMPVVDGFEAAPLLLERRPGQKILLCSALVDDTVRARAAAAGIAACVSKDDLEAIPRIARELAGA
jgi:CheY-like chemotaxis protein